jgi:hypothetical protein
MSSWEFYSALLIGPLGMFATAMVVYYMRQADRDHPPAE